MTPNQRPSRLAKRVDVSTITLLVSVALMGFSPDSSDNEGADTPRAPMPSSQHLPPPPTAPKARMKSLG